MHADRSSADPHDAGAAQPQSGAPPLPPPPASAKTGGKSCKGCLFYSSLRKSEDRNPLCVGFSRSLKHVPQHAIGESEMEAAKEGRGLSDFKYACIGYSIFINNKDDGVHKQESPVQLPLCVGLELLIDRRPSAAGNTPAHVHGKDKMNSATEVGRDTEPSQSDNGHRHVHDKKVHQPRQDSKTPTSAGRTFLDKFSRSSGIVASGVAKDLMRVGHYIKNYLKDLV